jgi:hypothetical protein
MSNTSDNKLFVNFGNPVNSFLNIPGNPPGQEESDNQEPMPSGEQIHQGNGNPDQPIIQEHNQDDQNWRQDIKRHVSEDEVKGGVMDMEEYLGSGNKNAQSNAHQ